MNNPSGPSYPVKILIVDDHALIRSGISAILKKHNPDWELYEAEDGVRAITRAKEIEPEIILLDYHMPRLDGAKAANIIKKARPESKIIMVSMDMSPEIVIEMINAGVAGIISKHSEDHELIEAIDKVQNGRLHLSDYASRLVNEDLLIHTRKKRKTKYNKNKFLTDRETDILQHIIKGSSNATIGRILSISIRTVENHKASIFRKCNVKSTIELIRFALKMKLVKP